MSWVGLLVMALLATGLALLVTQVVQRLLTRD
jgi:hypothetical protein